MIMPHRNHIVDRQGVGSGAPFVRACKYWLWQTQSVFAVAALMVDGPAQQQHRSSRWAFTRT
jgi:hypothetical protein